MGFVFICVIEVGFLIDGVVIFKDCDLVVCFVINGCLDKVY